MFGNDDIGIDLGTSSVLFSIKGKGIVLREPAVVAVERGTQNIIAVGEEARRMIGRTPANIVALRPLRDGVVADYTLLEKMLRYFMRKVIGKRTLFRPRVVVCVPSGVTEIEKRSIIDLVLDAGAKRADLVDEPLAAAIGAGIDVQQPYGSMIVNVGGGRTDLAVISLGRVVAGNTILVASDRFDESIIRYIRKRHNLMIGERTAEQLKINIGAAAQRGDPIYMDASGRSLITGLPKTVNISSDEMVEALDEPVQALIENIHSLLERTPTELAADIFEQGIFLTGGGAQLDRLDTLITQQLKVPCHVPDDPSACVANGIGTILENMGSLGRLLFTESTRKYNG